MNDPFCMGEPDVSKLISVAEAVTILDSVAVSPRVVRRKLAEAHGLRLAAALSADRDYPPFDKSLMDGYAVRRADVQGTAAELKVIGEVAAGQWPTQPIGPGQTIAIMTGAPIPPGADEVVPVEDVRRIDDSRIVVTGMPGTPGRFIAPRGSDCPDGRQVLAAGTVLGPAQIAVAASIGAELVDVFAAPRVAVLATGDELAITGKLPGPSQIRNSNSPMLHCMLGQMGCQVSDLGIVRDDPQELRQALSRGLEYDALFISGGMSMGEHDHVPRLLTELGVQLKITRLRIKPGKPFVFGQCANSLVFGLPGNPVSAFVCTKRLASRVLARIAGGSVEESWVWGKLDTGLSVNGPREFYQPAIRTIAPGRDSSQAAFAAITPLKWNSSADLFTLARANVLLVRAENDPALPARTVVRALQI